MRRKLSSSELIYVGEIRTRAVTLCVVRGGVDPQLLDAAFAAVLADHPSLRSRVVRDGDSCFLSLLDPSELPHVVVRPHGPGARIEEYNTPMPLGGPLVRAVLLTGPDEDTLILSVDHTVCDGRSATALCYRLWQYYADIQAGTYTAPDTAQQTWPVAIDDRFVPRTGAELDAYVQGRLEREGAPVAALPFLADWSGAAVPREGAINSRRVWLNPAETEGLLAFAKSSGVSVHGLVGASLLGAVRAGLSTKNADHWLACISTVDLRQRVEPEISREVMIPAASWYRDPLEVPAGADLIELAHRLSADLRDGVGRGDAILELQSLDRLIAHPELLSASVVMTNAGRTAGPPSPPGLEIVDMSRLAVSNKWNPQQGQGPLIASSMTVYGRFSIEMPYSVECFTAEQMDAVHDHVRTSLLEFADRASVPVG